MRCLALAATLLTAACSPGQGSDGYAFKERDLDRNIVGVTLVEYDTISQLRAAAAQHGAVIEGGREAFAFGAYSADRPVCTIHVVRPEHEWRPERWGHELAHCFFGRWHA